MICLPVCTYNFSSNISVQFNEFSMYNINNILEEESPPNKTEAVHVVTFDTKTGHSGSVATLVVMMI